MGQLLSAPMFTALDSNGKPIAGAQLYAFKSGTTTALTLYQDAALTTPHAVPVVADSAGRFPNIYYVPGVATRAKLFDASNVLVRDIDPLPGGNTSEPEAFGALGDGVSDETAYLQAAIDAVSAAGGGDVLLRGRYLHGNITVPAGVRLKGFGPKPAAQQTSHYPDWYAYQSAALHSKSGTTITMQAGSAAEDLLQIRVGLPLITSSGGATTAAITALVGAFTDTASIALIQRCRCGS